MSMSKLKFAVPPPVGRWQFEQFIANRKSDWTFIKFIAKAAYGVGYELRPSVVISPGLVLERFGGVAASHTAATVMSKTRPGFAMGPQ